MPKFVTTKQAAERLGVHESTVRIYADTGKIESIRTPGGQRRYNIESYFAKPMTVLGYCRVSSPAQKDDLERQAQWLRTRYPDIQIVEDTASALHYQRQGLQSILRRCLRGEKLQIVVAHRDRLARFGFELIEWIVNECGGSIVVLDDTVREPEREFTEDLLTLLRVFSCRLYGFRNDHSENDQALTNDIAKTHVESLVKDLSVHLQRDGVASESENRLL
jgi:excisionase family DNA binding protein